jgi:ribonuclease HI
MALTVFDVDTEEALGLLSAMKWMRGLHLNNVVFELDSNRMVDNFKHNRRDESVFEDIIKDCKNVFYSYFANSRVEFIRRQANEVAHCLSKAASCLASLYIFTDIPTSYMYSKFDY